MQYYGLSVGPGGYLMPLRVRVREPRRLGGGYWVLADSARAWAWDPDGCYR